MDFDGASTVGSTLRVILVLILVLCALPSIPHKAIRYYGCYLLYSVGLSLLMFFMIPVYAVRPKNAHNFTLTARLAKYISRLIGVDWELRNGHIFKKHEGSVIVVNHQSIFDVLGLIDIWEEMGLTTIVGKKQLLYVPLFGLATWLCGLIFLDRSDPKNANQRLKEASIALEKKINLCIFPEGTRNQRKGAALLPLKRGAFRVALEFQAPIVPVVISPYYLIDSKNKFFGRGRMIISVLEPVSTKGLSQKDLETVKERTYSRMSQEFSKLQKEVDSFRPE